MAVNARKTKQVAKKPKSGEEKNPSVSEAAIIEQVKHLAEPLCGAEGIELVYVEYQREPSGRVLRIYIDTPGGVKLEDCVHISRQLGDLLDVYLEQYGPYSLEVSSPGVNRPLGKEDDYEKFKGCEAKIKTFHSLDGRKNFKGVVLGLSGGNVKFLVDNQTVAIPFQEIQKARLINFNGEYPCLSQK